MLVIMFVSTLSLSLAFVSLFIYDFWYYQKKMVKDKTHMADVVGNTASASIDLGLVDAAETYLNDMFSKEKEIISSFVFKEEKILASYQKDKSNKKLPAYAAQSHAFNFTENYLEIYQDIYDDDEKICTIYLKSNIDDLYQRSISYASVFVFVFLCALALNYALSMSLQKIISKPILSMAETTNKISVDRDYSLRIEVNRHDEVGMLMEGFNEMLSQIEKQNDALVLSKEQAERSVKVKEQFLANMSHEIRTPMNAVMGMTDLLLGTPLQVEQKKYLEIIRNSADNLLVILNDILDFSKIESGKLMFEEKVINLSLMIQGIVAGSKIKTDKKQIKIITSIPNTFPNLFLGDPVRLNQILLNLYTNAIKFTEEGEITIGANVLTEDEKTVLINFYVKDTGIGIPEDKTETIFLSFNQASSDTTRKYGGSGLGLTICKQLVELQNGKISVISKVGVGSTFSFQITFKKFFDKENEKNKIVLQKAKDEIVADGKGKKVLLAEDNEINQMLVVHLLERWNFVVEVAENGMIAFEKLRDSDYSLVLMDVHMPELDGYQATEKIRSELDNPKNQIPIIAMTASALKGETERCLAAGMNDYIAKPFDKNVLRDKVLHYTSI
ncbi:MAG: response regulator [Bacteroidetes bacterium]|nr:MAG: response regulator [Bacteroidota bacterium]